MNVVLFSLAVLTPLTQAPSPQAPAVQAPSTAPTANVAPAANVASPTITAPATNVVSPPAAEVNPVPAVLKDALVKFEVSGRAIRFECTGNDVKLTEKQGAVRVEVGLSELKTGVDLRDKHMREKYLEIGKFPTAVLSFNGASLKFPEAGKTTSGVAYGDLQLHGVQKKVEFRYTLKSKGDSTEVQATIPLNMNDFGIESPNYLLVTVRPEVEPSVKFVWQGRR